MMVSRNGERRLRIAIPKGALYRDSVRLLGEAGLDVTALADPGRQLIISSADCEYIIAKPSDVPTYVSYGAVDCGIAGKDSLVEADLPLIEMVDLRFGGCRFIVAEAENAHAQVEESYRHLGVVRVATKYPLVAEQHFAAKGVQIEIVKLYGNIELAPLIGLADQIVDITATGTTLRENGLRIVDEVFASTARFVANPISAKTDSGRVTELADQLGALARTLFGDARGLSSGQGTEA